MPKHSHSDESNCPECGRQWDGKPHDHTSLIQEAINRAAAGEGTHREPMSLPPICGTCGAPLPKDSE